MSVWITGDIHAEPKRLGTKIFYEQKTFSGKKDEHIVIVGGKKNCQIRKRWKMAFQI